MSMIMGLAVSVSLLPSPVDASGGVYIPPVSETGAELYNSSSHIVIGLTGDGSATVTIASDVVGSPSDFAFVLPIPELLDDTTWGRLPDGVGDWQVTGPTRGEPNAPAVDPADERVQSDI